MLERIDDQRKKAVRIMLQKGKTVEETAEWFGMCKSTVPPFYIVWQGLKMPRAAYLPSSR